MLSLLAIFSDVVGPVGRGLDTAFAVLLGRGKALVPIGLLVGAGSMLAPRVTDEDEEEVSSRRGLRLALGLILVCATVIGLLYLDRTQGPARRAGGVLGAAIGVPLRSGRGSQPGRFGFRPAHEVLEWGAHVSAFACARAGKA